MQELELNPEELQLEERVVSIKRVSKTVQGGRRFRFTALVVIGDGNGVVGAAMGKAAEIPDAIRKGIQRAKKNLVRVPRVGTTIPHEVRGHFGPSLVLLRPAAPGTGIIASAPVRAVVELAGIKDILTKSLGSKNPINVVWATLEGLRQLRGPEEVARLRGRTVEEVLGRKLARKLALEAGS